MTTEQTWVVEYHSNNSGGSWWLGDADWKALEDAGWTVEWLGLDFCNDRLPWPDAPKVAPDTHEARECPGHRRAASYDEAVKSGYRWLGSVARSATIEVKAYSSELAEGVAELWWGEVLPGQNAKDKGCSCCGAPHSFYANRAVGVPA